MVVVVVVVFYDYMTHLRHLLLDRLTSLIPDTSRRQMALELPTREFEMAYRLDCRNLCADFCEDIEFRFSLGLGCLLRRFLGKAGVQRFARGYTQVVRCRLFFACSLTDLVKKIIMDMRSY